MFFSIFNDSIMFVAGITKCVSSVLTIIPSMIAILSGNINVISVNCSFSLLISTVPLEEVTADFTIPIPTPLPDTRSTSFAVESPDTNTKSNISFLLRVFAFSLVIKFLDIAFSRILSLSSPFPSSFADITILFPLLSAFRIILAILFLFFSIRSFSSSIP